MLCWVSGIRSMEEYKWVKNSSGTGLGNPLSKKIVSTAVSFFQPTWMYVPAYLLNKIPSEREMPYFLRSNRSRE